jgi:hypothetical protein
MGKRLIQSKRELFFGRSIWAIILMTSLLLSACENKEKELLDGSWKMIWMKNGEMQIDARDIGSPILSFNRHTNQYKMEMNTTLEKGDWKVNKTTLSLTPNGLPANLFTIDSLDKNTLIYHADEKGNQVKVFYVRHQIEGEEEEAEMENER